MGEPQVELSDRTSSVSATRKADEGRLKLYFFEVVFIAFGAIIGYATAIWLRPAGLEKPSPWPRPESAEQYFLTVKLFSILCFAMFGGILGGIIASHGSPLSAKRSKPKSYKTRLGSARAVVAMIGGLLGFISYFLVSRHITGESVSADDYMLFFEFILVGCLVGVGAGWMFGSRKSSIKGIGAAIAGGIIGIVASSIFLMLMLVKAQISMGTEFAAYEISLIRMALVPAWVLGGMLGSVGATALVFSRTRAMGSAIWLGLGGSFFFWTPVMMKPELFSIISPTFALIIGGLIGGIGGMMIAVNGAYTDTLGKSMLLFIGLFFIGATYVIMLYELTPYTDIGEHVVDYSPVFMALLISAGGPILFHPVFKTSNAKIIARIYLGIVGGFTLAAISPLLTSIDIIVSLLHGPYHAMRWQESFLISPEAIAWYIGAWAFVGLLAGTIGRLVKV